jgi:hypothetical protein
LIAASLFSAAPAFAVTCTLTNTSGPQGTNIWPYSTQVVGCTSVTSADLQAVQGGLWATVTEYTNTQNGVAAGYGPTLQAEKPPVYIFNTASDYSSFFGSNCPTLGSGVFGETWITPTCSTTGNKSYTVVLLESSTGSLQNQWLGLTAAHEMGHWFDETIMGTKSAPFSGTTLWNHVMNGSGSLGDYPNFNALVSACGTSAFIFNGLKDNHNPHNYICASNGQGPGLSTMYSSYSTNTAVLVAAVPNYYSDPAELFAEEVAVWTGDVMTNQYVDSYIGHNGEWNCTSTVVQSELKWKAAPGHSPSPYQVPSGCPAS